MTTDIATRLSLDLEAAEQLVDEAVATQGEHFVYSVQPGRGCYNLPLTKANMDVHGYSTVSVHLTENDPRAKTGCVVGTALTIGLRNFGQDIEDVKLPMGGSPRSFSNFVDFTEEALKYLHAVQFAQDNGAPWGFAKRFGSYWITTNGDEEGAFDEKLSVIFKFAEQVEGTWDLQYLRQSANMG